MSRFDEQTSSTSSTRFTSMLGMLGMLEMLGMLVNLFGGDVARRPTSHRCSSCSSRALSVRHRAPRTTSRRANEQRSKRAEGQTGTRAHGHTGQVTFPWRLSGEIRQKHHRRKGENEEQGEHVPATDAPEAPPNPILNLVHLIMLDSGYSMPQIRRPLPRPSQKVHSDSHRTHRQTLCSSGRTSCSSVGQLTRHYEKSVGRRAFC
jgi:hypothetical protein